MQYRKKPVVIEAVQFFGSEDQRERLKRWIDGKKYVGKKKEVHERWKMEIPTLEGVMVARPLDWIIKGVKGEFYPCKPDIFEESYEAVDAKVEKKPTKTKKITKKKEEEWKRND